MKYGNGILYGSGTLYGATAYDYPRVFWAVMIDWSGNGSYSDEVNNARYCKGMTIERGRDFFLNSDSTGYEPVAEGTAYITLDNYDGRYDPYNTLSPLYPNIIPGKQLYIYVKNGSTGVDYDLYTGYIDDIQPDTTNDTVTITAVDLVRQMKEQNINVAVETSITITNAMEAILDEAGITSYAIDSDLTAIPYWWVTTKTPFDAAQEICDSTLGTFFIAADGRPKYYNRSRSVSSVISPTQSELLRDIGLKQPWEIVRNAIEVNINTRVVQASGVIWTLRDKPYVAAGASLEVWGSYSYNNAACPAVNVATPSATADYTMNTVSDGSGTNLTANFSVTITDFGGTVKVTIANGGGTGGYATLLQVQGQAITTPDPTVVKRTSTASIAKYKTRKFNLDSDWLQTTSIGETVADVIIDLHSEARKFPIIKIQARPELQFAVDLFDRISLDIAKYGITGAFRVGKIQHEWLRENGQEVLTTMHLEPVVNSTPTSGSTLPWTLPVTIS